MAFVFILILVLMVAGGGVWSDIVIISLFLLLSSGLGVAFFLWGMRIAARTRVLEIGGSQVRLKHAGERGDVAHLNVAECSLLVHHVKFTPPRAPGWEGYAAVLHLGKPAEAERFALAATTSREIMERFAADFEGFGLRTGEGPDLTDGVSVGIGLRHRRIGRGECPRCGYDLLGRFLKGCSECGWPRTSGRRQ